MIRIGRLNDTRVRVGATYLLGAQAVFFCSGYAMHIVLGRYLGPVEYGLFGVTLYAATMIRTFVASGIPMSVARYVSSAPEQAEAIYQAGFKIQFFLTVVISAAFYLFAVPLADWLGDERLSVYFRIIAPMPLFFGIFFLIQQYYNGMRRFRKQAELLTFSYLVRVLLVIALAVIGYRAVGAVLGLTIASAVAALYSVGTRSAGSPGELFPYSALIRFSIPVVGAAVVQSLLTDMDIMFVKRIVAGNEAAGYYTSAKALAQVLPFGFYALSGAIYPAVSRAHAAGELAQFRRYVTQANRLLLLVVLPIAILVAWNAGEILLLVYGRRYAEGAAALRWLILSFGMLSFFIIHKTILTGAGFPMVSGVLTVCLLPAYLILQVVFTRRFGLAGAALSSALTFSGGVLLSVFMLYRKFQTGFLLTSTLRIFFAAAAMLAVHFLVGGVPVPFSIRLLAALLAYLSALRISGELKLREFKEFLSAFRDVAAEDRGNAVSAPNHPTDEI
jgi:O-antigen/teichoic acid export membrane protein